MFLAFLWGLAIVVLALQLATPILWTDRWRRLALLPLLAFIPAVSGLGVMTGLSLSGARPGEQSVIFTLPLFLFVLGALPGCLLYNLILILAKPGCTKNRFLNDWDEALSEVKNKAVREFFEQEIMNDQDCDLYKRYLRYRIENNRQWFLLARPTHVLAIQQSRFMEDLNFWRGGLSRPDDVKPVKDNSCLRFLLKTKEDFQFFQNAWNKSLQEVKWQKNLISAV